MRLQALLRPKYASVAGPTDQYPVIRLCTQLGRYANVHGFSLASNRGNELLEHLNMATFGNIVQHSVIET